MESSEFSDAVFKQRRQCTLVAYSEDRITNAASTYRLQSRSFQENGFIPLLTKRETDKTEVIPRGVGSPQRDAQ
jgi:hypothetical protein